jgi:excisionase family DNA binding protein
MKHYLNIAALAERLWIKRSTLYAWAAQGSIPHFKLGRLLRFDPDEIEAWLQTKRRDATSGSTPPTHRHSTGGDGVDALIARAKRDIYTPVCGKPDQNRATRKEETDGSV